MHELFQNGAFIDAFHQGLDCTFAKLLLVLRSGETAQCVLAVMA